ncbi:hypothetical protein DPMN_142428 [Dreissena polymorpha]|uniref:Uncharacterized protein n=1 Tax=Dreissena polymorpha TaxID=45954 RepID=A0A9D4JJ35_DREPO|nr:hypothetical protein DPMN_052137 [Dreissena polymorpha]KAH3813875.1 hypothetical protein DPMN_142346 [Dreissena polymorpha]KAH3813954.1 hypothetical protein DPMN_142428 [Dreissena polymorpha]
MPHKITTDITALGDGGPKAVTRSHQAKDQHLNQDHNNHRHMECPGHVQEREDSTSGRRDEEVKPHHPSNQ